MSVTVRAKKTVGENSLMPIAKRWSLTRWIPQAIRTFLYQMALQALGVLCVAITITLFLSVLTFSASDPSLNNVTDGPVSNLLGRSGAVIADLSLQLFGFGILVFAIPLAQWGWRLIGRPARPMPTIEKYARLASWPSALILSCSFLAAIEVRETWPYLTGYGGVFGYWTLNGLASVFAQFGPWWAHFWATLLSGLAAAVTISGATGFGHRGLWWVATQLVHLGRGASRLTALASDWLTDRSDFFYHVRNREFGDAWAVLRSEPAPIERPVRTEPVIAADDEPQQEAALNSRRVKRGPNRIQPGKREKKESQPTLRLAPSADHELPPLSLLSKPKVRSMTAEISDESLEQNARLLEAVLDDFGVRGEIIQVRPGPVVTLYELEPAPGIKSSRVIGLADDIARSMSAISARVAVVPGRNVIGIELPNSKREIVLLRELLSAKDYETSLSSLTLALGKTIGGEPVMADLATMPHLLVAGTTGSGKSVAINTMILSLLYRLSPEQCKLILIDPKMLELSVYDGIPHLLAPVVTDPRKAVVALKWVVREMEDRYRKMSKLGVRNISGFNARVNRAAETGEVLSRTIQTGFDRETGEPIFEEEIMELAPMPFIVVIVDEMADLMMVAGKDIEGAVQRLAQMARAAGIHLITATQRPSVDVITGTIKANFPTRISFQVTSKIDSRTILGEQGAEQLLGQGDMLFMAGGGRIRRVHSPFVSDSEVENIVAFLKKQGMPNYIEDVTEGSDEDDMNLAGFETGASSGDELYDQAVAIVARDRKVSTSYVQRRLQIGYNRAARIVEQMEEQGVISGPNRQGRREVLVGDHSGEDA